MKGKKIKAVSESGVTILETMIASAILLVGIVGVTGLLTVATVQNQDQGQDLTRTTMYAQDKMDQLMGLSFNDSTTDTTEGTSSPGVGLSVGGSTTTATAGYVDYLDATGKPLTSSTNSFFVRKWSMSVNAGGNLKTITVVSTALVTKTQGAQPTTTLVCFMTQ